MESGFPVIETQRLVLRGLDEKDTEEVFNYFSDAELFRYMDHFEPITTQDEASGIVAWSREFFADGEGIFWGAFDRSAGRLQGSLNYHWIAEEDGGCHRALLTYDLGREHQGRGLMTEAVRATFPYVFDVRSILRIEARTHVDNHASARVLERCGFRLEGVLRKFTRFDNLDGGLCDVKTFSLLREDWEVRNA